MRKIFFLLLSLPVILYAAIPFVAAPVISYLLEGSGVSLISLTLGYPSWKQIPVKSLMLEVSELGEFHFSDGALQFENTRLSFKTVSHQSSSQSSSSPNPEIIVAEFFPDTLLEETPEFSLSIGRFRSQKFNWLINDVNIVKQPQGIAFDAFVLNDKDEKKPGYSLSGRVSPGNTIELKLNDAKQVSVIGFSAVLTEKNGSAKFSLNANVDLLGLNLSELEEIKQGGMQLSAQGELPAKIASINDLFSVVVSAELSVNLLDSAGQALAAVINAELGEKVGEAKKSANTVSGSLSINGGKGSTVDIAHLEYDPKAGALAFSLNASLDNKTLSSYFSAYVADLELSGETTQIALSARADNQEIQMEIDKVSPLSLEIKTFRDLGFSALGLSVSKQSLAYEYASRQLSVLLVAFSTSYQDEPKDISGSAKIFSNATKTEINIRLNAGEFASVKLPETLLHSEIHYQNDLTAKFSLRNICEEEILSGTWSELESGGLSLVASKEFSKQKTLQHWLNIPDLPLNLEFGSLTGGLKIPNGNSAPEALITLEQGFVQGALGSFDNVQLSFSSLVPQSSQENTFAFEGTVAQANVGLPLNNIAFKGQLSQTATESRVSISYAHAEVFGGTLELKTLGGSEDKSQDKGQDNRMHFNLLLKDIDLAEVVATQDVAGLSATGKISGEFPFYIENGEVKFGVGKVHNLAGGVIRYESPLKDSPGLHEQFQYTLNILENFNYEFLKTSVSVEGESLMFKSQILGRNPDFDGGQAINLNLNTDLEWQPALKYMRLQSGIEAAAEEFSRLAYGSKENTNVCRLGKL